MPSQAEWQMHHAQAPKTEARSILLQQQKKPDDGTKTRPRG
jgi:hypothetical protein